MQQPSVIHEDRRFVRPAAGGFVLRSTLRDAADLEKLFVPPALCAPLALRPFTGSALILQNGAIRITAHSTTRSFQMHRGATRGFVSVGYAGMSPNVMQHGRALDASDIVVVYNGDAELNFLGPAEFVWIDLDLSRLPDSQLIPLRRVLPSSGLVFSCDPKASDALRASFPGSVNSLDNILALTRRALESSAMKSDTGKLAKAYALVERAENFMWDNVEDAITLDRICDAVGCRARSLTYYFKSLVGVGPMTYLKIRRLDYAHRRLRESNASTRVFDVAADFGFWHMGHFSADYKRMFGITPSETRGSRNVEVH